MNIPSTAFGTMNEIAEINPMPATGSKSKVMLAPEPVAPTVPDILFSPEGPPVIWNVHVPEDNEPEVIDEEIGIPKFKETTFEMLVTERVPLYNVCII